MSASAAAGTAAPDRPPPPAWVTAVAGQVAGMTGLSVIHPVDTVKCRLQAHQPGEPKQALDVARALVRSEGVGGLYRGLSAPLLAFGAINCINFTIYSQALTAMERFGVLGGGSGGGVGSDGGGWQPSMAASLLGGALAGVASSLVRGPAERVKTVLQAGHTVQSSHGSWQCASQLVRQYGVVRGLFTGTGVTMLREVPQMALYFLSYNQVKEMCMSRVASEPGSRHHLRNETLATMFAGGTAGVIQWFPTYPVDVIKTRIQAEPPGTYRSIAHCIQRSVEVEGRQVLWRGCGIALVRAFPLHGTIFLTCESVKSTLTKLLQPEGITYRSPNKQHANASEVSDEPTSIIAPPLRERV